MQPGFFSKKEVESTSRPKGKTLSCVSCGLLSISQSPRMEPYGNFKKKIMIIGEASSSTDDRRGKLWQGMEGALLKDQLNSFGIDLFEDCLSINSVRCLSKDEDNGDCPPSFYQIDCCRATIFKTIKEYQPSIVLVLGGCALFSIIGDRWQKDIGEFNKWRGWCIPDQELNTWVCPVFHPNHLQKFDKKEVHKIWKDDFTRALSHLDIPFPKYIKPHVEIITDLSILNDLHPQDYDLVAFDYETTGLKPHATGHRIVCASVAVREDLAWAFMLPATREERQPFTDILESPLFCKMAHNMKFEDTWTNVKLRTTINNWYWDSMIAAHVLDNRPGICGLKFQSYVQFGIIDYASEISPFLEGDKKDSNSMNKIQELIKTEEGKRKLLEYCGLDSAHEFRLAKMQQKIINNNPNLQRAYDLFHKGITALAAAERQGLRIDVTYLEKKIRQLGHRIEILEEEFKQSQFFRHWQHVSKGPVNINADSQLAYFLYNIKKLTPLKFTETGKGSTDEDALQMLNIPELNSLLQIRKLKKTKGTYLEGFMREQVNGYMHPFFNLHTVQTYRSSSDSPNFQNIPKRDKTVMKLVRDAIYPRPGNQLMEVDFSGLEVSIAACYHKDPTMLKYLIEGGDMHGDVAKQLFHLSELYTGLPEHKYLRYCAKNGFVFAQFYGDYYKNNAIGICQLTKLPQAKWNEEDGIDLPGGKKLGLHMIENDITSFDQFVNHIKGIEKDFWENRFPVYAKWKEKMLKAYQIRGYVDSLTGFRFEGVMRKNELINYPVQGAAFHCLLWSFIRIHEIMIKENWKTKIVGQIHDAIVLDIYPPELSHVSEVVKRVTEVELAQAWKWIIVPLRVEADLGGVDESWSKLEKFEL